MLRPAIALLILGTVLAPPLAGQARWYVEASRVSFDIDSDFDDSLILSTSTHTFNIPALRKVDGLGVEIGQMHRGGAWSMAYLRADPAAESVLGDTVANLRSYGLETMLFPYLKTAGRVSFSPTLRLGVGLTWLKLPGSATDGTIIGDATYRSLGFNLGAGAIFRVRGFFHVVADYTRRFVGFDSVQGLDQDLEINGDIGATADYIKIGAALYLP